MSAVFVDTSYLIALLRKKGELHSRAVSWPPGGRRLILTEYVIIEFLDAMCAVALRRRALAAAEALYRDAAAEIIPVSRQLSHEASKLYEQHVDKEWGLTNCASFCVMRARGLTDALTADRHFEQAGFRALLRADDPASQ